MPETISYGLQLAKVGIQVAGAALPLATTVQVTQVCVEEDVNLPGMFTLEFAGLEDRNSQIALLDDQQFAIGSAVQIKMGYDNALVPLMNGEITGLEPAFHFSRSPSLIVRGYDRRHRLQRGRKTRTFVKQKDSAIASQIASEVGLTAKVDDSKVTHDYVLQANQSDWDFLQARAHRIGYELIVDDKTLKFRPVANAGSSKVTLSFLNDLLEFYPRLSAMGQVPKVAVQGWDVKTKKALIGKAQSGDEVSKMGGKTAGSDLSQKAFGAAVGTVSDRPIQTQAEADQIAKAAFNQHALTLITGEGVCYGRTDLRAGIVVRITDVGTRFSGDYYVTTTSHRYDSRGYYTHFTVRRTAS